MVDPEAREPDVRSGARLSAWEEARRDRLRGLEPLVAQIEAVLFRHDPIGIADEDNTDEYRSEAGSIALRLPGVTSEAELLRVVHQGFVRWFDRDLAGPASGYAAAVREIWALAEDRAGRRSAGAGDDRG